jgi:cytochrome c553
MLLGTPNKVVTPNITPDKRTGIGTWTTEQVVAALRNGLRPDGSLIGPPMPIAFYRGISDTDAFAIAAYLETVAPLDHAVPKSVYARPLHSYGPPVEHVADVPTTDKVAYGAYLAGPLAHCLECHTPATNGRPDPSRLGAGGRQFVGPKGAIIVSANLTPDRDQGLGTWTDQNIKDAITKGVRPDGSRLLNFMPFAAFAGLKDSDLDALVAYLRTLKPAKS